jgi:hypothetical protein
MNREEQHCERGQQARGRSQADERGVFGAAEGQHKRQVDRQRNTCGEYRQARTIERE